MANHIFLAVASVPGMPDRMGLLHIPVTVAMGIAAVVVVGISIASVLNRK